LSTNQAGVKIGIISGGVVNFGGAVNISPISVTKSTNGAGGGNSGAIVTTIPGSSSFNQQ
jgi:hypothetical protein